MKTKIMFVYGCIICAVLASVAPATPLTFICSGTGSGWLNGVPFAESSFVITSQGNTDNRQVGNGSGVWIIDHSTSSITITGLGTFGVLTGTRTFVNNNERVVGYSTADGIGHDLFYGPHNSAFGTWDMLGPIGPISGAGGELLQWGLSPINTTGGILLFATGRPDAGFTAITPEPTTMVLLGLGGIILKSKRAKGKR